MRPFQMQRREVVGWAAAAIAAAILPFTIPVFAETNRKPVTHIVDITDFVFVPKSLEVRPGDRITWVNKDIVPHTATADDKSWDTGALKPNERKTITVTKKLLGGYFCRFHPSKIGRAHV